MLENVRQNKNDTFETTPLQKLNNISINENIEDKKYSDTLYLIFTVLTGILLLFVGGAFVVWSSPAVVILKSNDTDINPIGRPITTLEISMLTGIPVFTSVLGSLFLTLLSDKIGRKRSLQLFGMVLLLNAIGLAYSKTFMQMLMFYSIIIMFFRGSVATLAIYLTEICEDHNRAKYGCLMVGFFPVGQLYSYILGPFFTIRTLTFFICAPIVLFLISFGFAAESPTYLLAKGKKEECIETLKKLRSNKTIEEINIDYIKITKSLHGSKDEKSTFWTVFRTRHGRVGILLALLPLCAQFYCGVPIILPLIAPIFNDAGISLSGNTVAILVGVFRIGSFIFTAFIVEKVGRKPILLFSTGGACIPVSVLGLFFYLKQIESPVVSSIQWLPVVSVLAYIFIYSVGLGPLPNSMMSEFFPSDLRSSAVSFMTATAIVIYAIYTFAFPLLAEIVGMHWCMWIFGLTCFGSAFLMYYFLPETRGKSIYEIQEMLKNY